MKARSKGLCALCKEERVLRQSHIVPAFVIRWMKRTSATAYLRTPVSPNVPQQDGEKVPLLCSDCEQVFSDLEKTFAEKIFLPYHDDGVRSFAYDTWLERFAISLVWRAVVKEKGVGLEDRQALARKVQEAADCWADFLLGRTKDPGPYDQHLMFWDPELMTMVGPTDHVPDNFMWYVLRSSDATLVMSDKTDLLYGYSKLPQMFFFSGINPRKPEGLRGTIIKKRGLIGMNQSINNRHFIGFVAGRVRELRSHMAGMSDKQRHRIEQLALVDPERTVKSKSFAAFIIEEEFRRSRRS